MQGTTNYPKTQSDRLIKLAFLLLFYWHEYLDMVFSFKSVTGLVKVNLTVIPTRPPSQEQLFVPKISKTTIYQTSFFHPHSENMERSS